MDENPEERLSGRSMVPPQGRPDGVTGAPKYAPPGYHSDTYFAAGTGLARRIRGFRGLYDMSASFLAEQLNVPEATVLAWESAQESPTMLQFCLLCDAFKTTPNGLLMGPFYVQDGPLRGLGNHLETLPGDAQMAILFIARIAYRNDGRDLPESPYL